MSIFKEPRGISDTQSIDRMKRHSQSENFKRVDEYLNGSWAPGHPATPKRHDLYEIESGTTTFEPRPGGKALVDTICVYVDCRMCGDRFLAEDVVLPDVCMDSLQVEEFLEDQDFYCGGSPRCCP